MMFNFKHKERPAAIEDEKLKEYLEKFNCTNCHNHCSLDKIRCGRGAKLQQERIEEFNSNK